MYRGYKEFERGRLTLRDVNRSGHPLTAVTERNLLTLKIIIRRIGKSHMKRFGT